MFESHLGWTIVARLPSEAEQEFGGRVDGGEELHGQEDGGENRVLVQQGKASTLAKDLCCTQNVLEGKDVNNSPRRQSYKIKFCLIRD